MKVTEFDYELPLELIAQRPADPRDAARLLHVGRSLSGHRMADLPGLLRPDDLLVVNDSRVIPARLTGRRGGAKVEVTLHKELAPGRWAAFARPAKRLRPGDEVVFAPGFTAAVAAKGEGGEAVLDFGLPPDGLAARLAEHGAMPLPPYIKRPRPEDQDRTDYQTLFAARDGAVAAPTAGLHFTPALMAALAGRGIEVARVTLHVGAGTFLPVKSDDLAGHVMHAEAGEVTAGAAAAITAARQAGRRVVAVGTTVTRLLESAARPDGTVRPFGGDTDLFITPGYHFRAVDALITNFHLPRSTLLMLVSAFAGTDRIRAAYAHAIAERYRFYSYGDACLLEREEGA